MLSKPILESYDLFKKDPVSSIVPVARQGYCNENYVVITQHSRYIVRRLLRDDVNRELESTIHTLAYTEGLTSELLLYDRSRGLMFFEYLEGEHKERLTLEDIALVAKVLKRLHRIDLPAHPSSIKDLFSPPFTTEVETALHTLSLYDTEYVLSHHDLNPYNLIWQKRTVKLIDFEYAGVSDLYFDLASVSVEFSLSPEQELYFLESYFGKEVFFEKKLTAYKVLYQALCESWFEQNSLKSCSVSVID